MLRKSFLLYLSTLILCLAVVGAFFYFSQPKKTTVINNSQKVNDATEDTNTETSGLSSNKPAFFISGWLPYWSKANGAAIVEKNISLFSEIDPFAFGVNPDGSLRDTTDIKNSPWPQLREIAQKENVTIIPTIIWADAPAMHQNFSDPQKLASHIDAIFQMLEKNNFSGVDIDYEGKDVADRDFFTAFLESLRQKLEPSGKKIGCTIEARTRDNPPSGWTGTQAMSFANDFSALNRTCDSVRIMAYDQIFQTNGGQKNFENPDETPAAPNADIHWVEEVMRYALRFISPDKLVMGVPTYGWEFNLTKISLGYRYARVKSVSYPEAMEKSDKNNSPIERSSDGEPFFTYQAPDGKHLVIFSDAEAVREKITLAKNLGIKSISLFKLDGASDPQLFSAIKEEAAK